MVKGRGKLAGSDRKDIRRGRGERMIDERVKKRKREENRRERGEGRREG